MNHELWSQRRNHPLHGGKISGRNDRSSPGHDPALRPALSLHLEKLSAFAPSSSVIMLAMRAAEVRKRLRTGTRLARAPRGRRIHCERDRAARRHNLVVFRILLALPLSRHVWYTVTQENIPSGPFGCRPRTGLYAVSTFDTELRAIQSSTSCGSMSQILDSESAGAAHPVDRGIGIGVSEMP